MWFFFFHCRNNKNVMWDCTFLGSVISDREHLIDQGSKGARLAISCAAVASWVAVLQNWIHALEGGKMSHVSGDKDIFMKMLNRQKMISNTHTLLLPSLLCRPLFTMPSAIHSILAPPIDTTAQHCLQEMDQCVNYTLPFVFITKTSLRSPHWLQSQIKRSEFLLLQNCSSSHLHLVNSLTAAEITATDDCEIEFYNSRSPCLHGKSWTGAFARIKFISDSRREANMKDGQGRAERLQLCRTYCNT